MRGSRRGIAVRIKRRRSGSPVRRRRPHRPRPARHGGPQESPSLRDAASQARYRRHAAARSVRMKARRIGEPRGALRHLGAVRVSVEDRERTDQRHRGDGRQAKAQRNRETQHNDRQGDDDFDIGQGITRRRRARAAERHYGHEGRRNAARAPAHRAAPHRGRPRPLQADDRDRRADGMRPCANPEASPWPVCASAAPDNERRTAAAAAIRLLQTIMNAPRCRIRSGRSE